MPKLYTFMADFGGECMEKVRLDRYLAKVLGVPRSQVTHLIDKKMVLVNGVVAKKSGLFVEESDRVEILQNVEFASVAKQSSLPLRFYESQNLGENQVKNAESTLDSVESQNLGENNSVRSAQTRPLRGAKNREQGRSSGKADFLLEAEKRGSPPKSEKAAACWEHNKKELGGAGRGVQPFLRKEKNTEFKKDLNADLSAQGRGEIDSTLAPKNDIFIQRIYEDDDILILNKPPFLATHGAPSLKEPSLVEWLKAHKIQRSTISGELREGIVHRLDKQTSGALVVAKNNDAHNALSAQLADKTMGRLYLAIIDLPLKEDIEIECYLARNPKNRLKISKLDVRKYKKFAESKKELCEAPENSPASWCKKTESKGAVVPPADFLLEAEKRGSPPKSEKRQLLGTHLNNSRGEREQGGAALLRKEKNEISGEGGAESIRDLQSGLQETSHSLVLPRAINCARNDNSFRDSSPTAQNDKVKNSQNLPKFARYSKSKFYKLLPSKDGKKELILARLFTGRTHQIRAHLESINRHIVGDELYGYKRGRGENERVMLHAYLLELVHPKESRVCNSPLGLHSADLVNFGEQQTTSLVVSPKFTTHRVVKQKNHESQTENPSVVDSALAQNLGENNSVRSTQTRPLRGAKNRIQGCSSATADFLLEADKRGSPPKSEKRQLLARRGSGAGGAALLRKETSENCGEESAESRDLQSGLPRSPALARNDESFLDSANRKLRFIAPLFDDMKDYLAKNFDMEKVDEILRTLPARAF